MSDIDKVEFHSENWNQEQKKKPIHCEWYRKPWYKDPLRCELGDPIPGSNSYHDETFDKRKYSAYKAKKRLLTKLCKLKYGLILDKNFIYVSKVIGGKMVDGTKAKVKTIVVNLNKINSTYIPDQVKYIENLFNNE
jgi:hypothetical protein